MLPGPPRRENGGCSHCCEKGLLAYGAGSSIVIVDCRSMQVVSVLPMPPSSSSPLLLPAPFVTSLQWTPQAMQKDLTQELSTAHLRLAVGDRQGRIAIWDAGSGQVTHWLNFESEKGKLGIQDVCWVRGKGKGSWLLMAIHGPSLLAIWSTLTARCIWKYDAAPHLLVSLRRDPFDFTHVCVLGFKGLLLSIKVTGDGENEMVLKEHQLQVSEIGNSKSDKEGGNNHSSLSPALALFPNVFVKCLFSSRWAHILYVMFPREIIIFDLQYGTPLSVTGLPRGSAHFFDLITDVHGDLLYCAHVDGKLSTWKRKEGKQTYILCMVEALIPLMGTSVPSPTVLAVSYCSSELEIEKAGRIDLEETSGVNLFELPVYTEKTASSILSGQSALVPETALISISDDGKVWKWLLTAEVPGDVHIQEMNHTVSGGSIQHNVKEILPDLLDTQVDGHSEEENAIIQQLRTSMFRRHEPVFQLNLTGQLHLLSSTITTLAVPAPSLTATLTGGGNGPAIAVPLVALATQGGCIEVVDVVATAVVTSFSVHNNAIRGLRWLGNSRLVSFSYTQVNEKAGGYINILAVTCMRSGISRLFRVLQKPERAPVRALRASPSGRYLLILFREAPVEVWAMTRNPQM
ncbi:hypothetical protein KI387_009585, partial [Taxus chinensis]